MRVGIILAGLLLAGGVTLFLCLNSILKKGVETVGPELTGVKVSLGTASLSPFSGKGRLSQLMVGNPEGFKTPSAIRLEDVQVGVEISSLLSDTLIVDELHLQKPEITFEGSLTGSNLGKILDNVEAATTRSRGDEKKKQTKFVVKDLVISGGKIHASLSTPLGSKSATVALPDLRLQNIGSGDHGVTAAELVKQILKPVLASVLKQVAGDMMGMSKDIPEIDKAASRLRNILNK